MTTPTISNSQPTANDANNNSSTTNDSPRLGKATRRQKSDVQNSQEEEENQFPHFVFDPDGALVCYWTAAVAMVTLYNAWTIALRIAFPEMRQMNDQSYLPCIDVLCDLIYLLDIIIQLRTAYLQDGIPVFDTHKIRQHYVSQTYFIQDVICVLPSHTLLSMLPDGVEYYKYFLCSAGAARLTKLLKFHILFKFYNLAESFTSNPHLIRVLRLFLNLAIIIHWIACLYYLLSEYEGLGSNDWVYTNATDQQRFSRKYLKCLYWSAMTLTTIGDTNTPDTDLEYIFTGVIFLTGVFVFATVMGNVGDVISSMNANRQEFQARMDHIQMYLTHKNVPVSLQLKIKKWAEYTWSRTKATDESRLLNMLPERLRAEVAVHVHLDNLKKVKIFEQCETGFLCELVLKLRSQVFSPGDYVCRAGETGREMFIINHGKVEVIVNNPATTKPMVVAVLSEGNYFGEISLLRLDGAQNRRTADVRSIGYSELLCLSRRDLMAALVEYPEAKSVLEDQAKKRMKTNLQAQRAFSVDTLLRSSQEHSSMDSGIVKDEVIGHDVSEIKAMIEELKNANKAPGRSVWQMIAKCEVLQAKLSDKEKEVEDSKQRIKELENLLYSRHCPKFNQEHPDEPVAEFLQPELPPIRSGNRVKKQFSQDEGRQSFYDSSDNFSGQMPDARQSFYDSYVDGDECNRQVPDLKITPSSEAGSSGDESLANNNNFIKTSKITNIFEKPARDKVSRWKIPLRMSSEEILDDKFDADDVWNCNFTNETSIDHEIVFDTGQISMTTSFRDEFHLGDSLDLNVHTIPEENEEEYPNCSSGKFHADARPLSFREFASRSGRLASSKRELATGTETRENQNSAHEPGGLYQKRPTSTIDIEDENGEGGVVDALTIPDESWKHTLQLKPAWNSGLYQSRPVSTNDIDASTGEDDLDNVPTSPDVIRNFSPAWNSGLYQNGPASTKGTCTVNGTDDVPITTDGDRNHRTNPVTFPPSSELQASTESSGAHELKRLLDGQASKSFKSVSGMDFLRMASMRSLQSDCSRRSSSAYDSECDSEEDYASN